MAVECTVCGAKYPDRFRLPLRCSHRTPERDFTKTPRDTPDAPLLYTSPAAATTEPDNIWPEIHQRLADAIESGVWDASSEKRWHDTDWSARIPKYGCACRHHWNDLAKKIDWSSAEVAFVSLWELHNEVSVRFSGKPTITLEQCRKTYLSQPPITGIVAVTSIAPNRFERQTVCLNSWKRFGLKIASIVERENVDLLRQDYPQVDFWFATDGRPKIRDMAMASAEFGCVLLINSDIEIHGDQQILLNVIDRGVTGIRHNFVRHWWNGTRERWGIDVFSFTYHEAKSLPDLPLTIGQPVWDYWLLHHFRDADRGWIADPLFFHRKHDLRWSRSDWERNAKVFSEHYAIPMDFDRSGEFRKQFPYCSP